VSQRQCGDSVRSLTGNVAPAIPTKMGKCQWRKISKWENILLHATFSVLLFHPLTNMKYTKKTALLDCAARSKNYCYQLKELQKLRAVIGYPDNRQF
jgi:hypothetical protein